MLILAGTIPQKDMPLVAGSVRREGENLVADGQAFPRIQGTGAMISAALAATEHMGVEPPFVVVAGDIGKGDGTRLMYRYLTENIANLDAQVITLHYCQPFMSLLNQFCQVVKDMEQAPLMIADAGAMYAAKAAGLAEQFEVFTPDPSEIAFLADPNATHPAYISHHLFGCEIESVPEQIEAAYKNKSAAKVLVVKGATDYIARQGHIVDSVNQPNVPVMEAIGGTGDTITGLVSAFVYAGVDPVEAGILAVKSNRAAAQQIQPTPATRVARIVDSFPSIFKKYLCEWSGICAVSSKGGQ